MTPHSTPRRTVWIAAGLSATVALVALTIAVQSGNTTGLDAVGRDATSWSRAHDLTAFLRWVEVAFAQPYMSIYVGLLVVVLLWLREPRTAVLVLLANTVTPLATTALKAQIGRDRPEWQAADHALSSPAFPSGHASSGTVLLGSIILTVFALSWSRQWHVAVRISVTALGISLVALVCADRVLLGRHYPSDVLGGMLLGLLILAAAAAANTIPSDSPTPTDPAHRTPSSP